MEATTPAFEFLSAMGWSPDRWIDPSPFLDALSDDGYTPFPLATDFLSRFGGLAGNMPAHRVENYLERIHFLPDEAINAIYKERVQTYEERTGERLIVVGEAYNGHLTLMLSDQGRLYGGYDDYLCCFGSDIAEGLANLFARGGREVP